MRAGPGASGVRSHCWGTRELGGQGSRERAVRVLEKRAVMVLNGQGVGRSWCGLEQRLRPASLHRR
mgnify:CR=1 FL=1